MQRKRTLILPQQSMIQLVEKIEDGWEKGFKLYMNKTEWKDEIDYIQFTFGCCGINSKMKIERCIYFLGFFKLCIEFSQIADL